MPYSNFVNNKKNFRMCQIILLKKILLKYNK